MAVVGSVTIFSRALGLATHLALAWLLSENDFGVYGVALAVSSLVNLFRDAGVRELVVQQGPEQYSRLMGPAFWLAMSVSLVAGAVLAGIAPLASAAYGMSDLLGVLLICALQIPAGTPASFYRAKLRIDFRFKTLSRITAAATILNYGLMITLAINGFGPLSFVIPRLFVFIFEAIAAWHATGERLWRRAPNFSLWPWLFGHSKWLLLSVLAYTLIDRGEILVAGFLMSAASLGHYVFANQLLLQSVQGLLSFQTQIVLLPILSSISNDPERRGRAALRYLRALMLIGSPAALGLAVVADAFIRFALEDKWILSIVPLMIIGSWYPIRCTIGLTNTLFISQERYRANAIYTIFEGAALLIAALGAARISPTPIALAIGAGASNIMMRCLVLTASFKHDGVLLGQLAWAVLPAWLIALACAGATLAIEQALPMGSTPAIVRFVLLGGLFSTLFTMAARILLHRHLDDLLSVLPPRAARLARRLLLLPEHTAD